MLDYQQTRTYTRPVAPALHSPSVLDDAAVDVEALRDLELADALDARARTIAQRGSLSAARALHEEAMELRRRRFGEADPHLPRSFSALGGLSLREGRIEEARWLLDQAHTIACRRFQPTDLRYAATLHNLAVVTRHEGDYPVATVLAERALGIKVERLGWEHASVAMTLCCLGNLARLTGERQVAICYYARAREIYERTVGGVNAGLASALIGLARVHLDYDSKVSARFLLERALQIRESIDATPAQRAGVRILLSEVIREEDAGAAHGLLKTASREYAQHEGARPEVLQQLRRLLGDPRPGGQTDLRGAP